MQKMLRILFFTDRRTDGYLFFSETCRLGQIIFDGVPISALPFRRAKIGDLLPERRLEAPDVTALRPPESRAHSD